MAYEVKIQLQTHQDTLNENEIKEKIAAIHTKYEVEKTEMENDMLKSENMAHEKTIQSRNTMALALFLGLLLLGSLAFGTIRANRQKQKYNEQLEATVAQRTQELKTANESLEQLNYELKTFNYIASHDIKEPIRNVGNYAGLVFRKLPEDLKQRFEPYFNTIKNSTNQLYTLVEDFSRYTQLSKDRNIEIKPVDLNEITESLTFSLNSIIQKKNGQIINEGLPVIHSSSSLIYTILKNLIQNGLKYNQSAVPTVTLSATENDTDYQTHITDNGIGIKEEYHEKIFEMFKRLHARGEYEGSGIGLAIVKLLTNKLNVSLQLESEVGQGSTFNLSIPK